MGGGALASKILVVDDEEKILNIVENVLINEGYQVETESDAGRVAGMIRNGDFDLLILDLMMPGITGLEVCKQIRQFSDIPIIMLTARGEEVDKLLGLELGADDYVTKPFSTRELAARVKVILRRMDKTKPASSQLAMAGSIVIDISRFEGWLDGEPLGLTPTELKILHLLITHPGQVFSRLQILEYVFGDAYEGYERTIDTHISNIRRKIDTDEAERSLIRSVYGVGYKFVEKRDQP